MFDNRRQKSEEIEKAGCRDFGFVDRGWLVAAWLPCLNGDTTGSSSHPGFISQ